VEGKKRVYRPSEMLMVKDVSDRINQSKKKEVEAKQKKISKVKKGLGVNDQAANKAIQVQDEP
jgi:predicted metallo-beta-lactamase superfamily hydrolase